MQDRVSLYPGRVKLEPVAGQANTYDLTRADQPTQEGTPLNKASLLQDTTASAFGLGTDAVPDDALHLLSRFQRGLGNEYIWAKEQWNWEVVKSNSTYSQILVKSGNTNRTYVRYSDDIILDSDGNISLAEPITQIYPTYNSAGSLQLDNKYVQLSSFSYADAEVQPVRFSDGVTFVSGDTYRLTYRIVDALYRRTLFGYVNSPSPDAYPPAVSDGYTYNPLGQLGDKVRIATGSYTGTGTYGSSNPNSLTFSFPPEFLVVSPNQESYRLFLVRGMTKSNTSPTGGSDGNVAVAWDGSTVSWYGDSTGDAYLQLNRRGTPYFYFAIG
jgi:hypothetical protein|uniref:Tail fiber protein n=1 Tax=Siphoviridae sp. ctwfx1 TaxID=2825732 RepID=A0A8S5UVD2_9CAUD|nr:MAG TPA: hypothetical protein [Siphoviridae sp. ctwfx1]